MAATAVTLCGIELENPIIPASGTFGYGQEFAQLYDINMLGTFSFKGSHCALAAAATTSPSSPAASRAQCEDHHDCENYRCDLFHFSFPPVFCNINFE